MMNAPTSSADPAVPRAALATAVPAGAPAPLRPDTQARALVELGRALLAAGYRFTTVTPATHSRVKARTDHVWARDLADVFGWSRPFQADAVPPDVLRLMQGAGIAQPHRDGWRSTLRASTLGGQLYFHSAYPTSDADAVFFGPDTYRFGRALQRELTDMQAAGRAVRRAADVGAGAGPGAAIVALACPEAQVLALDINDKAMRLARINAELAGLANLDVRRSDLLADVDGDFDLIVSNPPYLLDPSERAYRHGGGELGAGLSLTLVEQAVGRLAPGGTLLLYTGVAMRHNEDPFLHAVAPLLHGLTWTYEEIDPDVFGEELDTPAYQDTDRIAAVWLKATRPQH
ncbi:N5-glutamine methyltransferase family protein [Pseudoduganella chitinolytica]|uniref:Class I SAM-dependent methyltransferase n=1 Tax=Pseudoduganella chitinolytica TaxID=34070 RepID=A0ABY8BHN1_9BURK|nr:class I SAM-dependent methyltransferase [Pseudoduganella chitinolytica]WEF34453.1 class I SAM-dependent methyltransferase [Pseudoduganella chitinolytica]